MGTKDISCQGAAAWQFQRWISSVKCAKESNPSNPEFNRCLPRISKVEIGIETVDPTSSPTPYIPSSQTPLKPHPMFKTNLINNYSYKGLLGAVKLLLQNMSIL